MEIGSVAKFNRVQTIPIFWTINPANAKTAYKLVYHRSLFIVYAKLTITFARYQRS